MAATVEGQKLMRFGTFGCHRDPRAVKSASCELANRLVSNAESSVAQILELRFLAFTAMESTIRSPGDGKGHGKAML